MPISAADILEFRVVEDGHHDFKEQVDLETKPGKAKFIDEVIAFLNVGRGNLLIGVKEQKTKFADWGPNALPDGDIDAYARKIQSLVQSSIDPVPTNIKVHEIEREGGSVVHVEIGEHRMQPYQNKITGGFLIRTDKQNKIIPRDDIKSYFLTSDVYKSDLIRLLESENKKLDSRHLMSKDGSIMNLGILTREFYKNHPKLVHREGLMRLPGPIFHERTQESLRGCSEGVEAIDSYILGHATSRFFVSDKWFIHGAVSNPFYPGNHGRFDFNEMRLKLENFLMDAQSIMNRGLINGPYIIRIEFKELLKSEHSSKVFNDNGPIVFESEIIEDFNGPNIARQAYEVLLRGSNYG